MSTHTRLTPQRKHTRRTAPATGRPATERPTAQFLSGKYDELAATYPSFAVQITRKRYVSIHLKGTTP